MEEWGDDFLLYIYTYTRDIIYLQENLLLVKFFVANVILCRIFKIDGTLAIGYNNNFICKSGRKAIITPIINAL